MKIVYTRAIREEYFDMIEKYIDHKKRHLIIEQEKEEYLSYYIANIDLLHFSIITNNDKIDVCETAGAFISHMLNNKHIDNVVKTNVVWSKILSYISSQDITLLSSIIEQGMDNRYDTFIVSTHKKPISCTESVNSDLTPVYTFEHFYDFFMHLIYNKLFRQKTFIKKCANCNKYFYPRFRSDTIYCDYFSPQDHNKTCKEYCSQYNYTEKIRSDEAIGLYQKLYSKLSKRVQRHPDNSEFSQAFEDFKKECKKWKAKVKSGEKSEQDYINWLQHKEENNI